MKRKHRIQERRRLATVVHAYPEMFSDGKKSDGDICYFADGMIQVAGWSAFEFDAKRQCIAASLIELHQRNLHTLAEGESVLSDLHGVSVYTNLAKGGLAMAMVWLTANERLFNEGFRNYLAGCRHSPKRLLSSPLRG